MRLRLLVPTVVAMLILNGLGASSAVATEGEWEHFEGLLKYAGGPAFTATSTTTDLLDGAITLGCKESTWSGTAAASGTSNASDAVLELFEMASWDKGAEECEGPLNFKFRVLTEPLVSHWKLHILWRLAKEPTKHFLGLILKFDETIENSECKLLVEGSVPVLARVIAGKPALGLRFGLTPNMNNVGATNNLVVSKLTESGVIGCAGIKEGDKPTFDGEYLEEGLENVTLE